MDQGLRPFAVLAIAYAFSCFSYLLTHLHEVNKDKYQVWNDPEITVQPYLVTLANQATKPDEQEMYLEVEAVHRVLLLRCQILGVKNGEY